MSQWIEIFTISSEHCKHIYSVLWIDLSINQVGSETKKRHEKKSSAREEHKSEWLEGLQCTFHSAGKSCCWAAEIRKPWGVYGESIWENAPKKDEDWPDMQVLLLWEIKQMQTCGNGMYQKVWRNALVMGVEFSMKREVTSKPLGQCSDECHGDSEEVDSFGWISMDN